jgi:hypothetical protein
MNRVEELVTDALSAHAGDAPSGKNLIAAMRGEKPPRRVPRVSRWLVPAVAAATVGIAVAATVVGVSTGGNQGLATRSAASDSGAAPNVVSSAPVAVEDSNGCRTYPDSLSDGHGGPSEPGAPPEPGAPSEPGADERMVPGTPTSVAICRYYDNSLAASRTVDDGALSSLVAQLNSLPTGKPIHPTCAPIDRESFQLQFGYADGNLFIVRVNGRDCSGFATNGTLNTQDTSTLPDRLHALVSS